MQTESLRYRQHYHAYPHPAGKRPPGSLHTPFQGRSADTAAILENLPSRQSRQLLVPRKTKEGHLSAGQIENLFRRYLSRANITTPGTVHTLRHCFATHALEAGTDILCIKQLLGHTNLDSTNVYLHLANTTVFRTGSPADNLRP